MELPAGSLTAQQESTAKERLAALEKVLGTLAVAGPEGTKVQLDQFTETVVPVRLHGTGGTHSLNVKLPGKSVEKREVLLDGGQTQKLDVSPTPAVVKHDDNTTPPPPKEVVVEKPVSHFSAMKAIGFTAIGVGATSAIAALILGISAQDAGDAYNRAPNHDAYVHANALADWCTGAWITAGVMVAVGVTLVLIPEKSGGGDAAAQPEKKKEEKPEENARLQIVPSFGGFVLKGTF